MARFVFKLQAVLTQREHEEKQCQRELAVRTAQLVSLQNMLREMDQTMQSAIETLRRDHLVGTLDLGYLAAHRRFANGIQRQALTLMQRIALAQKQVDEAQAKLAEAARSRKIIEKLRERQLARWQEEQARKQQTELDEVGMQMSVGT